jgi:hypothetical protein
MFVNGLIICEHIQKGDVSPYTTIEQSLKSAPFVRESYVFKPNLHSKSLKVMGGDGLEMAPMSATNTA